MLFCFIRGCQFHAPVTTKIAGCALMRQGPHLVAGGRQVVQLRHSLEFDRVNLLRPCAGAAARSHVRGSVRRNFSVTEATTTSLTLRGPWVEVAPSVSASFKHLLGRLPSRYLQRATGSIQSGLLQKFNQAAHSMVATAFMIRLHLSRTAALMSMLSFTCRTKDPSIIRS